MLLKKIMWNSRAFCHVFNNDDTSKCREFKVDVRYFYGNEITHTFNSICAFESIPLLKPSKPWSRLPVPNRKATNVAFCTESVKDMSIWKKNYWLISTVTISFESCFNTSMIQGYCNQVRQLGERMDLKYGKSVNLSLQSQVKLLSVNW